MINLSKLPALLRDFIVSLDVGTGTIKHRPPALRIFDELKQETGQGVDIAFGRQ